MATRPSLEDLLKDVPLAKLNQPCSDECLCELALSITKWHSIAPHLGLTDIDEEEISSLYPNELGRQTVAMLRKWKSKHGKKATYKRLARVFWRLAFTNVVEEICELLNSPDSSDSESDDSSAIEPEAVSELQVQQPHFTNMGVLNSYAQYLRGRYSARLPTFLTLQWPPPPTQKVFNLAMIVKERIQQPTLDEELVRLTLWGNVDDIVARKMSVKLENIFEHDREKQRFVLFEGAPGTGKSTLAWHICQKWECGELFQEFRVVIFVQLRDPGIQNAKSLADLLPAENEMMASDAVAQISACRGQGVLFVVDSWDELPVQYHKYSIFERLLCYPESLNLHLSTLLITSRPIASGRLQLLASSRIEIVGFTKSEVKEYFHNALGDSDLVQKLQDQLAERPVIEAACYIPLNAAIIAHLFLDYQTLSNTLHGVFTSVVVSCITRHLTKLSGKGAWDDLPRIESLDELPPEVENDFCSICLLAYQGIIKNQVTFSSQDLQSFQPTLSSPLNTLSLIQGTESFQRSILYNFLHLQIQELLAAFHISKLPPSEQVKIFKDLFGQSRFAAVFEFYAAFTKLETEGIREIVAGMVTLGSTSALVSLLHCLYEAQDLSLCEYMVSLLKGKLDLSSTSLSPVACLSVGYFLHCTRFIINGKFEVDLRGCSLDNYKIAYVVQELSKHHERHVNFEISVGNSELYEDISWETITPLLCCCCLFSLVFSGGMTLENSALYNISHALTTNCSLVKLNLSDCDLRFTESSGPVFTEMLKVNQTLQSLNMSFNGYWAVGHVGTFFIAEGLLHNSGLKHLDLSGCGITAEGANSIADALKVNSTLECLVINRNHSIGDTGVHHMAEALKSNSALKGLDMSVCGIAAEGADSIADALKVNRTLEHLRISFNKDYGIGDTGFVHIAEALKSNNALKRLDLGCDFILEMGLTITDSNGPALTEMLQVNKTLQVLDMSVNTGVADVGALFIAEGLQHNSGLKELGLHNCGITAEGANSIADALKVNRTLEHLSISSNSIGDTGVVHIAEALKSNHALKSLELANCRQTEKGLAVLSASLVVNKCLQYLDIATTKSSGRQTQPVDQKSLKEFVWSLQENLHLTRLRLGPARDAPDREDLVEGEKSALNQVRRDKCLQELEIEWVTH